MQAVPRVFILPFVCAVGSVLIGIATYLGLEVLLASYTLHDRRLWEGGVVALVINGGNVLADLVLQRVNAKKKEDLR